MPTFAPATMTPPQIELRFSAKGLANKDFLSLSDPFLVCHVIQDGTPTERIGSTETVKDDLNPTWTTTISFAHTPDTANASLLIDVFDRDSSSDTKLTKHDFLGRAILRLDTLLTSPFMQLDIPLASANKLPLKTSTKKLNPNWTVYHHSHHSNAISHSWSALTASTDEEETLTPQPAAPDLRRATTTQRASKNVRGTLTVYAEKLSDHRGVPIVFRVSSAHLRDAGPLGRRVTQFYELQRERKTNKGMEWICVYRSKDGLQVDRNNYIVFDDLSITEQQLHNMQPDRRLRLAFYKRHMKRQHELISYVTTSVAEMLATRKLEREASIPLEGKYGDEDGLGNVLIRRVERLGEEGEIHIHLRADHFLHKRFVSSLNDQPTRVRRLRQLPSFITMH